MKKLLIVLALVIAGVTGLVNVQGGARAAGCDAATGKDEAGNACVPAGSTECPANSMRGFYVNSIAECSLPLESPTTGNKTLPNMIKTIVSVVLSVVGIVAVIMIILGGIGFVTSQGDAAKVTKARNTLLYGVVGLVIALLAFAIVNFVLSSVFKDEEPAKDGVGILVTESKIA